MDWYIIIFDLCMFNVIQYLSTAESASELWNCLQLSFRKPLICFDSPGAFSLAIDTGPLSSRR